MARISYLRFILLVQLLIISITGFSNAPNIYYVNIIASGLNDGTSWANGFHDLQLAINVAIPEDEIWIAQGTYYPTVAHIDTFDHSKTFYISKSIRIYGGFEGIAGSEGHFDARDVKLFSVILSGDLGQANVIEDNARQVVLLDHVGSGMVLDGVTIENGYGFDGQILQTGGAGIYNDGTLAGTSNPLISNCIFNRNTCKESGGGFYNAGSQGEARPVFMNCVFKSNEASGGGGLANIAGPAGNASSIFINCQFRGNTARTADGGAITNIGVSAGISSPELYNCLFSGNSSPSGVALQVFGNDFGVCNATISSCTFAGNSNGALAATAIGGSIVHADIRNSIFWNNGGGGGITQNGGTIDTRFSLIPFGNFPGPGNLGLDPSFVETTDFHLAPTIAGDLHLLSNSIAIDAGSNPDVNPGITTDLDNKPRIAEENGVPGIVDMGAYEFTSDVTATHDNTFENEWTIMPNPATENVIIKTGYWLQTGWIRMVDMEGHVLIQQLLDSENESMDVRNLPSGSYLIQVIINGRMSSRKIMVE